MRTRVAGNEIYQRLAANGFEAEFLTSRCPLSTERSGIHFYAEFLTPLAGGAPGRRGKQNATQRVGGVSSQNLCYIEVLLAAPWSVALAAANRFRFANETGVQIANPVSFLAQKYLSIVDAIATSARRTFSTCMTRSTLSQRESLIEARNGSGKSGTSCTPTVFAPSKAQRQHSLALSPIRFVPHLESSRAEI
jgi:hypothetical protein